ncbi:hypothetical protein E2C01_035748 [Portunus trituberculatus]|uniref:Uncharacterized protein n=1 Tax=Portunus trituberculatus TaxID=210409 RepID=A0A5B7FCB4_PORTR|nr:hypothetical protein [Portunus trituberculatus]
MAKAKQSSQCKPPTSPDLLTSWSSEIQKKAHAAMQDTDRSALFCSISLGIVFDRAPFQHLAILNYA